MAKNLVECSVENYATKQLVDTSYSVGFRAAISEMLEWLRVQKTKRASMARMSGHIPIATIESELEKWLR